MALDQSGQPTHESIDRLIKKAATSGRLSVIDVDQLILYIQALRGDIGSA